jgi:hypothetical protein
MRKVSQRICYCRAVSGPVFEAALTFYMKRWLRVAQARFSTNANVYDEAVRDARQIAALGNAIRSRYGRPFSERKTRPEQRSGFSF